MKIAIAGGSGFIGSKLAEQLIQQGHTVFILTRNASNKKPQPKLSYVEWLKDSSKPELQLEGIDGIVNLAGESIGEGRWSAERKRNILTSRIEATKEVINIISKLTKKPEVLINASAIGYYGNSLIDTFTEQSQPVDDEFLAKVVTHWEEKASQLGYSFYHADLEAALDDLLKKC